MVKLLRLMIPRAAPTDHATATREIVGETAGRMIKAKPTTAAPISQMSR
jgi:hypothetical protein